MSKPKSHIVQKSPDMNHPKPPNPVVLETSFKVNDIESQKEVSFDGNETKETTKRLENGEGKH
jgi:hypothetical protein